MDDGIQHKDSYFVAVKVFLEKDGQFLILKDNFGDWDLPGGRIKKDEFNTPLEDVVRRKMLEEVGSVQYTLAKPELFMRHERKEHAPGNPMVRIFALGYISQLQSGEIQLSPRHTELKWVAIDSFDPAGYFKGGWLAGVEEYLKLKRNQNVPPRA